MKDFDIEIYDLDELEIPKYYPVFSCIFNLFGSYEGFYFKLKIGNEIKLLQRLDDLFVIYTMEDVNLVGYEMFTVDEDYKVNSAGFDDFEVHTVDGDRVIQERDSYNIESLVFTKFKNGVDMDGFDGVVSYVQYNQEHDVRLMLIYQQMYNTKNKVYSYHIDKKPFQILIEKGIGKKQKGSLLPVLSQRYVRCDYDYRNHNILYSLAVIKDYGLQEFMEKGAFALHKDDVISRYQLIKSNLPNGYIVTGFPFCKQYHYENFFELFKKYGFKSEVPKHLLEIHNDEYDDLNKFQAIATYMKEIEMTPPSEVIKLNLKFGGNGEDGQDC